MAREIEKCAECQQSIILDGARNCYQLTKGDSRKIACPSCYNRNQAVYKKEYEQIAGRVNKEAKFIKAKCNIESCDKSFLVDKDEKNWEAEAYRHSWVLCEPGEEGNYLTMTWDIGEDDHWELNKDSKPVRSLEEIIHRWMKQKDWMKIKYTDSMTFNTYQRENTKDDDAGFQVVVTGWGKKVLLWLKTQPNRETIRKDNNDNSIERERERANSTTNTGVGEYNQPNTPTGARTEWPQRTVSQIGKQFGKRSEKDRLNSLNSWRNSSINSDRNNHLPTC